MTPQKADGKDWEQEALRKSKAWIWDDLYMKSITDTEQVSLISRALNLFGNHLLGLAEQHFKEDVLFPEVKKLRKTIRYWALKHGRKVYAYKKLDKQIAQLKADRQRMIEEIEQKVEYWTYLMSTKNAQEMWSEWQELKKSLLKGKGAEKHAK